MGIFPSRVRIDADNRMVVPKGMKLFDDIRTEDLAYPEPGNSLADVSNSPGGKETVSLDGIWALTEDHDLTFDLDIDNAPKARKITFKGTIEDVLGDELIFRAIETENAAGLRTCTIALKGIWKTDKNNRITFEAAKHSGRTNTIVFNGVWNISRDNELSYKYTRGFKAPGRPDEHTVIFKGAWKPGRNTLSYKLEASSGQDLTFKADIAAKTVNAFDQRIVYGVTIKLRNGGRLRAHYQEVSIYGKWRLNRDFSVGFEVTYALGRTRKLEFGVEKLFGASGKIKASLVAADGKKLGFKNDAELFVALGKMGENTSIMGGMKVKF
jgi:hypothetical protein